MTISVAAIGFGRHFRRSLLPNLLGCERFTLAAIAERDPEVRGEAARRFPGISVLEHAQAAFEYPVDAVVISTDPAGHIDLTQAALLAGKHVFVEKPLGTDATEVRHLAQVARQHNKVVSVGTMWRHVPAHRVMGAWLRDNNASVRLAAITVSFPEVITRGGWSLDARQLAFYDMFIHPLDWARHLLGGVGGVDAVQVKSTRPDEIVVNIRLADQSGTAMATLSAATGSHAYQVSAWLHTNRGDLVEVDNNDRLRLTTAPTWSGTEGSIRDRPTLGWEPGQLYRGWARKGYAEELVAFADRINAGAVESNDLEGAADTLDVIHQCLAQLVSADMKAPR